MKFCWVTLHVNDMEESLAFYHGILGLPIADRHGGHGTEIAMLGEADQPKVELLYDGRPRTPSEDLGITVGLMVDSLDQAMAYMQSKQIPIVRGPIAPNPHVRFAFIQDPNGIEVQLVESK